jgi:hypothetical protein
VTPGSKVSAVPSIATSKVTGPSAPAAPPTPQPTPEPKIDDLSIDQVEVDPTTTEEISEYSGGSAPSLSEEESQDETESEAQQIDAIEEEAEERRERKRRGKKDREVKRETREEEESVEEPHEDTQRRRHCLDSSSSELHRNESDSVSSSYTDDLIDNPPSYDTESSFRRTPAVENVKRGNEKSMHKDIMSHGPGPTSAMMVRAMYYVPLPREDGDVVVEVEVS